MLGMIGNIISGLIGGKAAAASSCSGGALVSARRKKAPRVLSREEWIEKYSPKQDGESRDQ
jgi:hypothetical protein